MAYERYKVIRSKEEFFAEWDKETLIELDATLRDYIYKKYMFKCEVFQRDDFKCQNDGCKTPRSSLTMHHTKFKKNGGENKSKNCVTICKTCHKAYHRGKINLTYYGSTYSLHKENKINWKVVKKNSHKIRKNNKRYCGVKISWELWHQLLTWLHAQEQLKTYDDD